MLAETLIRMKQDVAALMVIILFETYLRPSELLAMKVDQIVPGSPAAAGAARWLTFLVHPEEQGITNKVNEYDHSVPLDLPRQQFLVRPILRWVRGRPLDGRLWELDHAMLATFFSKAVTTAGVEVLRPTLYGLRHAGASHDRSVRARGLPEVQSRGGWRSFSSVRRYEKHRRLGAQLMKIDAAKRRHAESAATGVQTFFALNFGKS